MNGTTALDPLARGSSRRVAGVGALATLSLRRDRWFWMPWLVGLAVPLPGVASAYERLVPPGGDIGATLAAFGRNPTMRALLWPAFALDTSGGFAMWRTPLGAAVLMGLPCCLVLAGVVAVSMTLTVPPIGNEVTARVGIGLVGTVGVGVGAVAAQLPESARTCRAVALGAAYLVRALADGAADASPLRSLGWLSPPDWAALARPYAGEQEQVLVLPMLAAAALLGVAFRLEARRDLGAGLLATSPGPACASPDLGTLPGLARRLNGPSMRWWLVAVAVSAVVLGTLPGSFAQLLADSPQLGEVFRRTGAGATQLRDGGAGPASRSSSATGPRPWTAQLRTPSP